MFTPFAFVKSAAAPSQLFFLDEFPGAEIAYSVRKLSSTHTGSALRVERSNDNTQQDIGFVGENLDTSALATFVGANTGKVVTWYDQSGNNKNATAAYADAPTIRTGGTTVTIGSKTAVDGTSAVMSFTEITGLTSYAQILVGKRTAAGNALIGFAHNSPTPAPIFLTHFTDNNFYFQWNDYYVNSSTTNTSADQEVLLGSTTSASTAVIERNGANVAIDAPVAFNIDGRTNLIMKYGGTNGAGNYQEFILYDTQQNSNFTDMQTNINAYYSIY